MHLGQLSVVGVRVLEVFRASNGCGTHVRVIPSISVHGCSFVQAAVASTWSHARPRILLCKPYGGVSGFAEAIGGEKRVAVHAHPPHLSQSYGPGSVRLALHFGKDFGLTLCLAARRKICLALGPSLLPPLPLFSGEGYAVLRLRAAALAIQDSGRLRDIRVAAEISPVARV